MKTDNTERVRTAERTPPDLFESLGFDGAPFPSPILRIISPHRVHHCYTPPDAGWPALRIERLFRNDFKLKGSCAGQQEYGSACLLPPALLRP